MPITIANPTALRSPVVLPSDFQDETLGPDVAPAWTEDRFESDVWRVKDPSPAETRKTISFERIPTRFRIACKQLVSALHRGLLGIRMPTNAGGAPKFVGGLVHFTQFLDARGIASFAAASEKDVEEALLDFAGALRGESVTSGHARQYLATLSKVHRAGPKGLRAVPDGLSFDPCASAINIGRSSRLNHCKSTAELPEELARPLLNMAIDWISNKASAVQWILHANNALSPKFRGKDRLTVIREHLREHPGFAEGLAAARETMGGPLTSLLTEKRQRAAPAGATESELDLFWLPELAKRAQMVFQGFAYVVCAGFNGWRVSEILSIEKGWLRETPSGHTLATKVRKTGANPSQPIDRPVPAIVALAINALAEISARPTLPTPKAGRAESGERIFRSCAGGPISGHWINDSVSAAWQRFSGRPERIKSHQFRRFFAYFFLRRHSGNIDAVRRHFRHVSSEMVWAYTKDALNAAYLASEKKELAQEIASSVISGGGHVSAVVGAELRAVRDTLLLGAKVLSVEDAAAYIDRRIKADFAEIHPMEWGYCLLQRGDSGAACEGQVGPIEDRSEPGVCGRCKFLCTGPESVPFWEHAAQLHAEIAASPLATQIMRAQSERFAASAQRILVRHKEGEAP